MKRALIIGGGFAGCVAAHFFAMRDDWAVDLFEKNHFLGAGVRTFFKGGHPFTFGPRHFLTQNAVTYDYMNKFCPLRSCSEHQFLSYVEQDRAFYNFPMHVDDLIKMPDSNLIFSELENAELSRKQIRFDPAGNVVGSEQSELPSNLEEFWLGSVGPTLYSKFVNNYNKKMWQVESNKLIDSFGWSPKGVTLKTGPRESWDEAITGYPLAPNGYNDFFNLATEQATVFLSALDWELDLETKRARIDSSTPWVKYDVIINTISLDDFLTPVYGALKYIGRDLELIIMPAREVLPKDTFFLYYPGEEKYTRIVEYKKLTKQLLDAPTTLLSIEYPSDRGKHYPVPIRSEIEKAEKYKALLPESVFSIGRAGAYDYGVDMDDCIEQVMEIFDCL